MNGIWLIAGIVICLLAVFILYKRLSFLIFGKKAEGHIIGYCNRVSGMKGIDTYNYKIEYEYDNEKHCAVSVESVQVSRNDIPRNNIYTPVTVFFKKNKPETVTISDYKQTEILGGIMLLIGIVLIVLGFIQ